MRNRKSDSGGEIDIALEKRAITKLVRGNGPAPVYNTIAYIGRERFAKNLVKKLLRGREESWTPPIIDNDMLVARYRDNAVLDELLANRKSLWKPPLKRRDLSELTISEFSFLDHPIDTLEALKLIAQYDATLARYLLHFEIDPCDDSAPFIVLGLMRNGMTPAASGGRLSDSVAQMITAVGLNRFLRMRVLTGGISPNNTIWPLHLQTKEPGQSGAQSQAYGAQRKEKVTDIFVDAINEWLHEAGIGDLCYELTKNGKGRIARIFAEMLDNAERHTVPNDDRGGGWHVAGFMARRGTPEKPKFICNISIVSPGVTIGESLRNAEDPVVAENLEKYCVMHRKGFGNDREADDLLRTVCALQDRVSRVAQTGTNPHGGVGIMEMIEVVNDLGIAPAQAVQPQVTIYSGTACIMVRGAYGRGRRSTSDQSSPRTLWLNAANSRDYPPDAAHAFKCKHKFPGTIVTARFSIDEQYISTLGVEENAND